MQRNRIDERSHREQLESAGSRPHIALPVREFPDTLKVTLLSNGLHSLYTAADAEGPPAHGTFVQVRRPTIGDMFQQRL